MPDAASLHVPPDVPADLVRDRLATAPLDLLGIRAEDRGPLQAAVATLSAHDLAKIGRAMAVLQARIGVVSAGDDGLGDPFAPLPDEPGRPRGLLPLLTLVAAAEDVLAFYRGRDIDAAAVGGIRDLGQQMWVHRLTYGEFGLHTQGWLTIAWSGALYWLGRLQFNLKPVATLAAGAPELPSSWVWSTHIPQSGPLAPQAVDDAFARAQTFFDQTFPELRADHFHCDSWLLDPQLTEVVDAASNLAQFCRRWQRFGTAADGDEATLFFVFHVRPPLPELATLPRETTLQRAVLDTLERGGHWAVWNGLIPVAR